MGTGLKRRERMGGKREDGGTDTHRVQNGKHLVTTLSIVANSLPMLLNQR